jgi:Flp pilus assembly protein CpaB
MKPKNLLIIAGLFGVVAVALIQVEAWRSRGGTKYIYRALRNVQPPATLRGAVERVALPASTYAPMTSQVPTTDLDSWVTGTPTIRPVRAGETITFDMLQKSADAGLQITAGMRAIGLEVQGAQAVGYLIRPGDYVDVLGTVAEVRETVTRHLLQARKVLAVGQQYRLEDSAFLQSRTYPTVTLEVTPQEAAFIESCRSKLQNGFTLTLRGRGDLAQVMTADVPTNDSPKPSEAVKR